ncbi:MAG: hypothetical protein B6226_03035 [Candidatus Cloacimonetes bacterium 4572_65]|nr:MAG: hypothetical protein B6226_03035 [Candidatus Cloacimonetes bacterium 4572_65]
MKKICVVLLMIMSLGLLVANQETVMDLHQNQIKLLSSDDYGVDITYELGQLAGKVVTTKGGEFIELSAKDFSLTGEEGLPQLPYSQKIIAVPLGAKVEAFIDVKSTSNLNLNNRGFAKQIKPAQPSAEKCADRAELPFVKNELTYSANKMYSYNNVSVKEIGILRNVRLFEVNFYPVSYNPVTNDLTVINSASIRVDFVGSDIAATEELKAKTNSFHFNSALAKGVFNYEATRTSLDNYPLGYVIITPSEFLDTLEPFINWKTEQGYNVSVGITQTIGSSTTAIKNYIQGIWDSATTENPAPSYLLIVGDVAQVPAYTGSTDSGHITDLNYVRLEGNDYLPEMYYGRFSATSVSQLLPQVNKTLMYEKYEMSDPSYLARNTLIAGADASWAPTHGNGTLYYGEQNYFNDAHGLDVNSYPYPASSSSANAIFADINEGVGYLNYTAHGSETTWHDPLMTISNINSFTNDEMYPVVVGNCCLTNHFNTPTCFGEAWLRAENGAVIYIGGTNSTYWDEDYWWSVGHFTPTSTATPSYAGTGLGMFDALFHEHDEDFTEWVSSAGSMIVQGNMTVQGSSSNLKNYYWEIYSIMGDPSLMPYIGVPDAQTPDYVSTLLVGMTDFNITAAPHTYAAISRDGVLIGATLVDGSGNGTISFDAINVPGNIKLVLSHTDFQPYITELEVIPADGAYVVLDGFEVDAPIVAGQDLGITLGIKNVGTETIGNVNVTLSSTDTQVNITSAQSTGNSLDANQSISLDDFAASLVNGIQSGETITFDVSIDAGDLNWAYQYTITAVGPSVIVADVDIDDGDNNNLDPGDTADIIVGYVNNGDYVANNMVAVLSSSTPGVAITTSSVELGNVAVNGTGTVTFTIDISEYVSAGTNGEFEVTFSSDNEVSSDDSFNLSIGLIYDSFESGDFSGMDWNNTSWTVVSNDAHHGTHSAKSNAINHSQNTILSISLSDVSEGDISFWIKVSSEPSYDKLSFHIDNQELDTWSGEENWQEITYPVAAGDHTFTWKYSKDGSVSSGSDYAWVDYIIFPSATTQSGTPSIAIDATSFDFGAVNSGETVVTFSNSGDAILSGQITGNEFFTIGMEGVEAAPVVDYFVNPNEEKEVTIYFVPTENIAYSHDIAITSNDPTNNQLVIAVNGVGEGVPNSDESPLPVITELKGNYPNPFNPETTVRYAVKENGQVSLKIFNIKGQLVKTLVNQEVKAGNHAIVWNGKNSFGTDVATGIYMYRLETKTYNQTKKMMLMK